MIGTTSVRLLAGGGMTVANLAFGAVEAPLMGIPEPTPALNIGSLIVLAGLAKLSRRSRPTAPRIDSGTTH